MLESQFQSKLIKELKDIFPGCIILKNDPEYIQGFPDLTILYCSPDGQPRWALLECKRSENESHRPNQDFYIAKGDEMAFGRFVYPENKEEVLYDIQQAFQS